MINSCNRTVETREVNGRQFEVLLKALRRPSDSLGVFPPLEPGSAVMNGIRVDRDVALKLRDGTTIYTDVYRPDGATNLPAIVAWSPYGKRAGYAEPMHVPGVPKGTLSPGTKLEGPDPDFWCRRGFAIINPDPRGVGNSEGVLQIWTKQEARDAADLIEWAGVQPWCNGRVGMSGNSWLAISQWMAAAERPPHLACIAPWEGATDVYRQLFRHGGIRQTGFVKTLDMFFVGSGFGEDLEANIIDHPFHDDYWLDKIPDLSKIEVPAYVTASWSHFHLWGSLEGYRAVGSKQKWLRIHREFEWPDAYAPENLQDLERFFDRFLKGLHNGWELTPPVRLDVMDRGDREHATRRPEIDFPLPDTKFRKLFLDAATASLSDEVPAESAEISYDAASGSATFEMTFAEPTELTGYLKLRLWVEARGADDMDLFVAVQKAGSDGTMVPTLVIGQPHPGAPGLLRVSHRALDDNGSTDSQPRHLHLAEQRLAPGEIVPVDIPIWPLSRLWHPGERLRVVVSGHYVRDPQWFENFAWELRNAAEHVIHTGGRHASYLLVPEIPRERTVLPGRSVTSGPILIGG